MIYWLPIDFSIPFPIPTLGMVAWWLVIGDVVMVWLYLGSLFLKRTGACVMVAKLGPLEGLFTHLIIVVLWPLVIYGVAMRAREHRRIQAMKASGY